ncbi:MAG: hypothetical protein A2V85_09825 [Chloroflexi bacterium RBG_16_72_14]|nr:MAG: hypothetical protein A2V85_09825 [Chloroflexi bacterium RBG_16_72_14]
MDAIITTLIEGVLVPLLDAVVAPIPYLASSGMLLVLFAAAWVAFGVALVRDPSRIDRAWRRLRSLPLLVQAIAWLLLLPVIAGAWIWRTSWPRITRLTLIGGLAGWNLLVFLPRPA